jgi:hypothetical protein
MVIVAATMLGPGDVNPWTLQCWGLTQDRPLPVLDQHRTLQVTVSRRSAHRHADGTARYARAGAAGKFLMAVDRRAIAAGVLSHNQINSASTVP